MPQKKIVSVHLLSEDPYRIDVSQLGSITCEAKRGGLFYHRKVYESCQHHDRPPSHGKKEEAVALEFDGVIAAATGHPHHPGPVVSPFTGLAMCFAGYSTYSGIRYVMDTQSEIRELNQRYEALSDLNQTTYEPPYLSRLKREIRLRHLSRANNIIMALSTATEFVGFGLSPATFGHFLTQENHLSVPILSAGLMGVGTSSLVRAGQNLWHYCHPRTLPRRELNEQVIHDFQGFQKKMMCFDGAEILSNCLITVGTWATAFPNIMSGDSETTSDNMVVDLIKGGVIFLGVLGSLAVHGLRHRYLKHVDIELETDQLREIDERICHMDEIRHDLIQEMDREAHAPSEVLEEWVSHPENVMRFIDFLKEERLLEASVETLVTSIQHHALYTPYLEVTCSNNHERVALNLDVFLEGLIKRQPKAVQLFSQFLYASLPLCKEHVHETRMGLMYCLMDFIAPSNPQDAIEMVEVKIDSDAELSMIELRVAPN